MSTEECLDRLRALAVVAGTSTETSVRTHVLTVRDAQALRMAVEAITVLEPARKVALAWKAGDDCPYDSTFGTKHIPEILDAAARLAKAMAI